MYERKLAISRPINRFWKRIATALRGISFSSIWCFRLVNLQTFLKIGRFILYPLNIAITLFIIGFTLYELYLNPSTATIINATTETLTGVGIVAALLGSLMIGAAFSAIIAPVLLLICFAIRALKSLFYDLRKHCQTTKEKLPNILNFIAGTLSVAVIGLVLIAEMPVFGVLGIVSGIISAIAAVILAKEQSGKNKSKLTASSPINAAIQTLPNYQNGVYLKASKQISTRHSTTLGFFEDPNEERRYTNEVQPLGVASPT